MSERSPSAAKERAACRAGRNGEHQWVRVYRGATLNAYKCVCGAEKTTKGTAIRGR